MINERRSAKRFSVVDLEVFNRENDELLGHVINLSVGGMLVMGEHEIKANEYFDLRIPFKDQHGEPINYEVEVMCVWCTPDIEFNKYSIGFQFLGDSPTHYEMIQSMVDRFQSQQAK